MHRRVFAAMGIAKAPAVGVAEDRVVAPAGRAGNRGDRLFPPPLRLFPANIVDVRFSGPILSSGPGKNFGDDEPLDRERPEKSRDFQPPEFFPVVKNEGRQSS